MCDLQNRLGTLCHIYNLLAWELSALDWNCANPSVHILLSFMLDSQFLLSYWTKKGEPTCKEVEKDSFWWKESHTLWPFCNLPHLVDLDNNPKDIRAIGTTILQVIKLWHKVVEFLRPSCFHSEGHPGIKSTGLDWPQTADHIPTLSCVLRTHHSHATISGFFPFQFFAILLYSPSLPYSLPSFLPSCIHLTDMGPLVACLILF